MNEVKTAGQVLYEASIDDCDCPGWEIKRRQPMPWPGLCATDRDHQEHVARAVIEWHESQQWRPMSEQGKEPITDALVAFECLTGGKPMRWVEGCRIEWACIDDDPYRYVQSDGEPIIADLGGVAALAWRHLPAAPEVPR